MTKRIKKLNFAIISIIMALLCGVFYCLTNYQPNAIAQAPTRNIEVSTGEIDYQSVFDDFEDSKLETNNSITTFEGTKTISIDDLSAFDNLSESDLETCDDISVKYNFSFDAETGLVTLSATTIKGDVVIEVDEIQGVAFYNEYGDIDAYLDVDGEYILLSELQDAGMIANCGWFKKLWKKVAVATVAVIAVATVATIVLATCGAGLGACIAAGAIAGGITGGVAGGIISYSEYGKLDWRWIVGGAVVGGALGAAIGWGVGTAAMKTPTAQTNRLIKAAQNGDLKFSKTVTEHYASGERPYCNSKQLVEEIMKAKNPIKDPRSATGLKWEVEGALNSASTKGKTVKGIWELVVDPETNTVWHLLFKG